MYIQHQYQYQIQIQILLPIHNPMTITLQHTNAQKLSNK